MQKAEQAVFEPFDASSWRIAIILSQFNKQITEQLYKTALTRAEVYQLKPDHIRTIHVAGSMEIPLALQQMAISGEYQALLAIGCVIKGETPHFDYVCKLVTEGILRVELDHQTPVGFGVLTCNTLAQAQERAKLGGNHLDAVMQLAKTLER